MGSFAIKPIVQIMAWIVTAVLVYLNLRMVASPALEYLEAPGHLLGKAGIVAAAIAFISLLIIALVYPLMKKNQRQLQVQMHPEATAIHALNLPSYNSIAVALDFSENDQKLLAHALGQGNRDTRYVLVHVVESVPARLYENESDDLETEKDKEHLAFYATQLSERGFAAESRIGFGKRAKEIARLVKESGADMLVIGAHGHSGIKDFLYGETINSVRHELKIPVLIVNL